MSDEADPSAAGAPFRASVARTPADVLVLVERIRMHAAEVQATVRSVRVDFQPMLAVMLAAVFLYVVALFFLDGYTTFTARWQVLSMVIGAASAVLVGHALAAVWRRVLVVPSDSYRRSHGRLEEALQMAVGVLGSDPSLRREHPHAWLLLTEAVELGNDILQRAPRPRHTATEPTASSPSPGERMPTATRADPRVV